MTGDAGDGSGGVLKQVHRLFNMGAVGSMTDAQLLERFISRRDEAGEAAFEELVIRHGPMVLDVCRRVLARRARRGRLLSGDVPRFGGPSWVDRSARVGGELALRRRLPHFGSRASSGGSPTRPRNG